MPKKTWIANYIFEGPDGSTRTEVRMVTAHTEQEAHDYAAAHAPAEEFVVSLHPQSDDQVLGSVRQSASRMKELREGLSPEGTALREVLAMLLKDPDADIGEDLADFIAEHDEDEEAEPGQTVNGKTHGGP